MENKDFQFFISTIVFYMSVIIKFNIVTMTILYKFIIKTPFINNDLVERSKLQ